MRRKVAIYGRSQDYDQYALSRSDLFEFWGLNNLFAERSDISWTRWFEIHEIKDVNGYYVRKGLREFRGMKINEYLIKMSHLDIPVYMREENPLIPTSIKYPKDEVVNAFGRNFNSTFSWMLGLAIIMNFSEIAVFGITFPKGTDYEKQRPNIEHLLGIAKGRGICVRVSSACNVLNNNELYGFDQVY